MTSFYKYILIKENNKCVDSCSSGELLLDTEKGNYCSNTKNCDNYLLLPDNICVNNCDKKYFVSNENKECGLCKDLYKNEKIYKILDDEECISKKPENTFYVNENMKIISYCDSNCKKCSNFEKCEKCESGYKIKGGKCTKSNSSLVIVIVVIILLLIIIIFAFIYYCKTKEVSRGSEVLYNINKELTFHNLDDIES